MPAITWIQYTERMVGQNHPVLTDTLNRALRSFITNSGGSPDAVTVGGFIAGSSAPLTNGPLKIIGNIAAGQPEGFVYLESIGTTGQGDGRVILSCQSEDDDHPLATFKAFIASSDAANFTPGMRTYRARGTLAAPSTLNSGDTLGSWDGRGYTSAGMGPDADGFETRTNITVEASEAWGGAAQGTAFAIALTPVGSTTLTPTIRLTTAGLLLQPAAAHIGMGTLNTAVGFNMGSTITLTGSTIQRGAFIGPTADSGATSAVRALEVQAVTAAAAFTALEAVGLLVQDVSKGAGSAITTAYGVYVTAQTQGGTNYAIYTNAGFVRFGGSVILAAGTNIQHTGNVIVTARKTGWTTVPTGTPTRTTFDTATVTLPQLAERVKALIDDLHATAGHGLIGA